MLSQIVLCVGIYISGICEISSCSWLLSYGHSCIEVQFNVLQVGRSSSRLLPESKGEKHCFMHLFLNYFDLLRSLVIVHSGMDAGAVQASSFCYLYYVIIYYHSFAHRI
jgi:hypothetical protein